MDDMADYPLEQLGEREFEHLSQSLLLHAWGPSVRVYGDGADGGRDATYNGRAHPSPGVTWDGYVVVQAKFRQRIGTPSQNLSWLLAQVRSEVARWSKPDGRRSTHGRAPEYLLFTTNVPLSSVENGGSDQLDSAVAKACKDLDLKGAAVWHRDQISRLLDDAGDVRRAYNGLLTVGDVLGSLSQLVRGSGQTIGPILTDYTCKQLLADRWVRLSESGDLRARRLDLTSVAIDLPAEAPEIHNRDVRAKMSGATKWIIQAGNRVLRPSIIGGSAPHVLVVGGPGQGKSTVSTMLTQMYRAVVLTEEQLTLPEQRRIASEVRNRARQIGVPLPSSRRWPLRVNLPAYGDAISGGSSQSLMHWIAAHISAVTDQPLNAAMLRSFIRDWPVILVLDGLDEVADIETRDRVFQAVENFRVDAADADLMLVVTTRPQGYGGEFSSEVFSRVELSRLEESQARDFATQLAHVRLSDDANLRDLVIARVGEALAEPVTSKLMATPLQVTIITLLLEARSRAPQSRHALFEAYYRTIFTRESEKLEAGGRQLEELGQNIDTIHEAVGFELQILSEGSGDSDAAISPDRFHDLVCKRLESQGYSDGEASSLAREIARLALERLVLLVPRGEGIGFEIRSLQEYMAARYMTNAPDDRVLQTLRATSFSAHWRNAWLLAAGRVNDEREYLMGQVVSMLRAIDAQNDVFEFLPTTRILALEILDDGIAGNSPMIRRQLLKHGLESLEHGPLAYRRIGDLLQAVAENPSHEAEITRALERAFSGPISVRITGALVARVLRNGTGAASLRARQLVSALSFSVEERDVMEAIFPDAGFPSSRAREASPSQGRVRIFASVEDEPEGPELVTAFFEELHERVSTRHGIPIPHPTIGIGKGTTELAEALMHGDESAGTAVALALLSIPPEHWPAAMVIRGKLTLALERLSARLPFES